MHADIPAIILAAGYSSRMSALKSLYPVGNELMIERSIRSVCDAGIRSVYVVTGYKGGIVKQAVENAGIHGRRIIIVNNPDYDKGMLSSVLAGLKALPADSSGFLLLPVDCPFVSSATVKSLLNAFEQTGADVVLPFRNNKAGHPPVVRNTVFDSILRYHGDGGLRHVLTSSEFDTIRTDVADDGVLDDVDDDESYIRLMLKHRGEELKYPLSADIKKINEEFDLPRGIIAHMDKVNELALGFAESLNAAGLRLNPGLLSSACRLHDICKGLPDHAEAAGQYLSGQGFPEIAAIVSVHMNIGFTESSVLDEAAILYLADKMVEGVEVSRLTDRMEAKLGFFTDNSSAAHNIRDRFNKALAIKKRFERVTGQSLDNLNS